MPDTIKWSQCTHCFVAIAEFFRNRCLRTRLSNFGSKSVERVRLWSGVSSSICFVCLCSLIWDRYLFFCHRNNRIPSTAVSDVRTFIFVYVLQCCLQNWRILFLETLSCWYHVTKPIISNSNDSLVLSVIFLLCWLYSFDNYQGIPCDDKVGLFFLSPSPPALQSNDSRCIWFDHLQKLFIRT